MPSGGEKKRVTKEVEMKSENQTAAVTPVLTWDQALFSFCFVKYIPVGKAKRKENLVQTFYETSSTHFFDWLTFAESANQNYFRCIFHAWKKCRLADLKNSFYLLIFSAKNKTVSTITFNFLRD